MAFEPAGFSQPQGISPDGEIMQPPLVADVLVAVPPPLLGAQAPQSPGRVPPGVVPHSAAAVASTAFAHAPNTNISHDEGPRLLPSRDDGMSAFSDFYGYEGLQGTRPHPDNSPFNPSGRFNRDREVGMYEALDASRGLNAQGRSDSGLGPELDTSGTYSTPEP